MEKAPSLPVYDSSKRGLPAVDELRELLHYRNLVFQTVRRNIIVRYKRSVLGVAWTMLSPLGTTIIMSIVFSQVFGATEGYAAYVLCGLTCWTFFAQGTSDAMTNLIWGESLLRRIYIPRTTFAVSSIGTGLVNLGFALVPLAFIMLVTGIPIKLTVLFLPVPVLFLAMFTLGVGLFISTVAVFFNDVAQMYQILLTAWMYLSPVIYHESIVPERYLWIIRLNPMYYLINLFRAPIYYGQIPDLDQILLAGCIAFVSLLIGWIAFCQKADEIAYRV